MLLEGRILGQRSRRCGPWVRGEKRDGGYGCRLGLWFGPVLRGAWV